MNVYDELLVLLADQEIEFITVGGLACAFNGYVRTTDDVDILIHRDKDNIKKTPTCLIRLPAGICR
jgi:hypothetical protein